MDVSDCINEIFKVIAPECIAAFGAVCKKWREVVERSPVTAAVDKVDHWFVTLKVVTPRCVCNVDTFVRHDGIRTLAVTIPSDGERFPMIELYSDEIIEFGRHCTQQLAGVQLSRATFEERARFSRAGVTPLILKNVFNASICALAA
jgi:hypothetical protein